MAILTDALSDIGRMREIGGVFARHGFGQFLERINLGRFVPGRVSAPSDLSDEAKARQLIVALEELGPSFIKFGQILSTRGDVLPPIYVKALQSLQDRVKPFSYAEVRTCIEAEFGRPIEDLFDRFEETPLASASIGQVHRAYTKDGMKVAVKIQRPNIDEMIRADVSLLYSVARIVESVIDLNVGYTPTEIVGDFDRAMRMELDFGHEAKNAQQFSANFREKAAYIRFPEPVAGLSGRTVLTMNFIEGVKVSEAFNWPQEKRQIVAGRLLDACVQMIFQDGFFHGDPHPGNIFVDDDCNIMFLDVGLAGSIPKYLMDSLLQLVISAAMKDSSSVARIIYKLGAGNTRVNLSDLKHDIEVMLEKYFMASWGSISASDLLTELMEKGAKHGVKHPPELASLSKGIINFEGTMRMLYPELDLLEFAKPYAAKYFNERMNFDSLKPEFIKRANEIFGLLSDLPLQVSQLMMDLEKGRVNVTVTSEDIRSLQAALRSLAITLFLSIVTGTLLLGSFIALAGIPGFPYGLHVAGVAVFLAMTSGFFVFAWHLVAIRLRRPKLTELMKKKG